MFAEDAQKPDQHKHAANDKRNPDAAGFAGLKDGSGRVRGIEIHGNLLIGGVFVHDPAGRAAAV